MLVQSKIDNSKWIWINIPKTASTLVRNAIFGYDNILDGQIHLTYTENVAIHGWHTGFTVVRDPLTRFRSGLNHVFSECACGQCTIFYDRPPITEEVIGFLSDIVQLKNTYKDFHKLSYNNGSNNLWLEILKAMQKRFIKSRIIMNPSDCVMWAFILPQFLYLDKMDTTDYIFRYENLSEYAKFIENTLGYRVNTQVKHREYTYKLNDVDFTSKEIQPLLHQYYSEDYNQLNY